MDPLVTMKAASYESKWQHCAGIANARWAITRIVFSRRRLACRGLEIVKSKLFAYIFPKILSDRLEGCKGRRVNETVKVSPSIGADTSGRV